MYVVYVTILGKLYSYVLLRILRILRMCSFSLFFVNGKGGVYFVDLLAMPSISLSTYCTPYIIFPHSLYSMLCNLLKNTNNLPLSSVTLK